MGAHEVLKALWAPLFNRKDTNMPITFNKTQTKAPTNLSADTAPLENVSAIVKSSVGLKFSNGYEFNIIFQNKKMIVSATIEGKEAFYLDDIPQEFIDSLKSLLDK